MDRHWYHHHTNPWCLHLFLSLFIIKLRDYRCMLAKILIRSHRTRIYAARLVSRCLTTDDKADPTAWIPPERPLIGDQRPYAVPPVDKEEEEELQQLQKEIDRLDEAEKQQDEGSWWDDAPGEEDLSSQKSESLTVLDKQEKETKPIPNLDQDSGIDWMKTRRRMLGEADGAAPIMQGQIAGLRRHEDLFKVEVLHHTLLSKDEIATIMESLGGQDIVVIYDDPHNARFGHEMARILVTASRPSQMKILADTLVRQMRLRKLQEVGVFGAKQGPEGNVDSNWMMVDCRNFVVHIMEEQMRKDLNFEALWTGKDELYNLDFNDEDAVDRYVAANPPPPTYGMAGFNWNERYRELQKHNWSTLPPRPKSANKRTRKKKGKRR